MARLALCIAAWVAVLTLTAHASQSAGGPEPPVIDTPAQFAHVALLSLSSAADAQTTLAEPLPASKDAITSSFAAMLARRKAISSLSNGVVLVTPFTISRDPLVAEAAGLLRDGYTASISGLHQSLALEERLLKAQSEEDLKEIVGPASEIAAKMDEGWKLLPVVIASVTHTLVDADEGPDGRVAGLRITAKQKAELIAQIEQFFPDKRDDPLRDHATRVAARMFKEILQQEWRTRD